MNTFRIDEHVNGWTVTLNDCPSRDNRGSTFVFEKSESYKLARFLDRHLSQSNRMIRRPVKP